MIKTIVLHILGGIIAFSGEKIIFGLFYPDVAMPLAVICMIMILFYIGVGYALRDIEVEKIIITMQVMAFLSRDISVFGEAFVAPMSVINGGSRIWMRTAMHTLPFEEWSVFIFYVLYFFVFPIFIYVGKVIFNLINKITPAREKREVYIKAILIHIVFGLLFGICRMNFVLNNTSPYIMLLVLSGISVILYTGFGMWLRKERGAKTYLVMSNISLLGLAISNVSFFSYYFVYTLIGGGLLFADFGNLLFINGFVSKLTNALIFLPPLLVLLGQMLGNKVIKPKKKEA